MKTSDGRDETESQTISRSVATVFEPIKALEHMFVLIAWNSGPIIRNRNDRRAIDVLDGCRDVPSRTAVLDRIVHEIGDRIEDQIAITGHQHFALTDGGEMSAVLFGGGIVQLDNFADDVDQVDGA